RFAERGQLDDAGLALVFGALRIAGHQLCEFGNQVVGFFLIVSHLLRFRWHGTQRPLCYRCSLGIPAHRSAPVFTPMRPNYESSSGAETPRMLRPLYKTCRTAATSASRAKVSVGSSALTNRKPESSRPFAQKP